MKVLLILPLFCFTSAFAQSDTVIIFHGRDGKICKEEEAVKFELRTREMDHYKKLMVDMMDNKVQSIGYFSDSACEFSDGPYREIYKNGRTMTLGYYHENKKINTWKTWSDDGKLMDSFVYVDGYIQGIGLSWNKQGIVTDSLIFEKDGNGVGHGYWSNGIPSESGSYRAGKKDGMWTYYYKTGKKSQEVNYVADSAVALTCYDEKGNVQQTDCVLEREAAFRGGDRGWLAYLKGRLAIAKMPNDYGDGRIYGTIWIQFVVDVDGTIQDAKVVESVDPRLDEIALDIVRSGPRWQHAVQYNRPVKAYRKQPITFARAY